VAIRYNTGVRRLEVSGGRVRAVLTDTGERIPTDAVVVNADLPTAYRELLPPGHTPRRVKRLTYSPSAVVLHAGSQFSPVDPAHHTIHFGTEWERTFDEIIDRGEPMSDPSFLLTQPTVTDPFLAPADRHTYYALFPTPNLRTTTTDWRDYPEHVLDTLEKRGYDGFRDGIECSHVTTPYDWHEQGITAGAPFAAAHTFGQTGPFRPPTLDRRIENLVFAGSNTQPGVGVPMVLISGRLAAERIVGA
jgi:phytoene desaturase